MKNSVRIRTLTLNIMKKTIVITFTAMILGIAGTSTAHADTCQPIFGGGENCTNSPIAIKKQVLNPATNSLVDSLGVDDPKYHPGDIITFQLKTTVTSSTTVANIVVKDTFPQNFVFSDAPGTYDKNTNTLTYTIPSLNTSNPSVITIIGRISSADQLPSDQAVICQTNQANATANNQTVYAASQYCIENPSVTTSPTPTNSNSGSATSQPTPFPPSTAKTTPDTGNETIYLLGLLLAIAGGFLLRKKAV